MGKIRSVLISTALVALAAPAAAQDVAPAAAPVAAPVAAAPFRPADSNVELFYAARPGTLIWLRSADTRAAAAKLPEILRRATIDGLADGPALAASVEAAIARSQAAGAAPRLGRLRSVPALSQADDKIISDRLGPLCPGTEGAGRRRQLWRPGARATARQTPMPCCSRPAAAPSLASLCRASVDGKSVLRLAP